MTAPAQEAVDISTLLHSKPGVNGGRVCLAGTGISVRAIAVQYKEGRTPQQIVDDYSPAIDLPRVFAAITYYLANTAAIEADLAADAALFEELDAQEKAAGKR